MKYLYFTLLKSYIYLSSIYLSIFIHLKPILSYCYFPKKTNRQLYMKNIGHVPVHSPFWREKNNESGILTVFLFTWWNVLFWSVYSGSQFHAHVFNSQWACSGLAVEMRHIATGVFIRYSPWYLVMAPKLFRQVLIIDNEIKYIKHTNFKDILYRKNDILELDCKISSRQNWSLSAVSSVSACAALLLSLTPHWSGECASQGI